ncbi:MAG: cation:proton antiporter [Candidatus Izimaplasma sp.]|nr:cation:proton antiporter [Candidatus Izimaplasma bacterium]
MLILVTQVQSNMSAIIVSLGIIIFAGLIIGRLFEQFKIPAITGYLVAGLILGPVTHVVSLEELKSFSIISNIALGFIAFQVGTELWFGKLKKSGWKIIVITILQAVLTTAIVIIITLPFVSLSVSLVLGAIAAATAPAPIMMIIKKYRTKGELTDTILPVVGLDDAVGVILFGILLSISVSLIGNTEATMSLWHLIKEPLLEILTSILIGSFIGLISGISVRTISQSPERNEKSLNVIVVTVLMTTGAAMLFGASPILTPMIAGTVTTNLINKECYHLEESTISFFIPPIMIAFFTIAGAQLEFDVVMSAGLVGLIYIVGRTFGKIVGSYFGATIVKASPKVKKYLGVGMLPQSGVAIGLSIAAFNAFYYIDTPSALIIKNVILASVLFFALTGPVLVKIAFMNAKETRVQDSNIKKVKSWKNSTVYQQ